MPTSPDGVARPCAYTLIPPEIDTDDDDLPEPWNGPEWDIPGWWTLGPATSINDFTSNA